MSDEDEVRETFENYSSTFERLNAEALLSYYHYPCILINQDKSVAVKNQLEAWFVLKKVISDLKKENYAKSPLRDLKVKLQSNNLATITGAAKRLRKDESVILDFGFTYTLRKGKDGWKIIVGIIHDVLPPS